MQDSIYWSLILIIVLSLVDLYVYKLFYKKGYFGSITSMRLYLFSISQTIVFILCYLTVMYLLYDKYVFYLSSINVVGAAVKIIHITAVMLAFILLQYFFNKCFKVCFASKWHILWNCLIVFIVNLSIVEFYFCLHNYIFPPL